MAVKRWNGSAWVVNAGTTTNATSANTVSTIVQRDGSGDFSAGTITATTVNATNVQMGGVTATSAATNNALVIRDGSGGFSASGTVSLPSTTSIGNVSSTEIGYLDNVTSAIQTQLDSKERLVAKLTTATAAIADTDTRIIGFTADANSIVAGDTFRFIGYATRVGTNTPTSSTTFNLRIGPTTLTGNVAVALTTTSVTAGVYKFEALATVRTAGASGTVGGAGKIEITTSSLGNVITIPTVAINTTVANQVEATIKSGHASNTYQFSYAILEKLPN